MQRLFFSKVNTATVRVLTANGLTGSGNPKKLKAVVPPNTKLGRTSQGISTDD